MLCDEADAVKTHVRVNKYVRKQGATALMTREKDLNELEHCVVCAS